MYKYIHTVFITQRQLFKDRGCKDITWYEYNLWIMTYIKG